MACCQDAELVGVAGYEPAASSSRSHRPVVSTKPSELPTCGAQSANVRMCRPLFAVPVTHFVAHGADRTKHVICPAPRDFALFQLVATESETPATHAAQVIAECGKESMSGPTRWCVSYLTSDNGFRPRPSSE